MITPKPKTSTSTNSSPTAPTEKPISSAMEKLLDAVFANIAKSNPTTSLTTERKNFIEQRFLQLIPTLHTPSHPPYALMIDEAIKELNVETGSSEESISAFIKMKYDDLPWAHENYLSHYLEKLKQKGEIYVTRNNCYKLKLNNKEAGQKRKRGRPRNGKTALAIEECPESHEQETTTNKENGCHDQRKVITEMTKDQSQPNCPDIETIKEQEQSHVLHDANVDENYQRVEDEVFEEQNWLMGPQAESNKVQNIRREVDHEMVIDKKQMAENHKELNEEKDKSHGLDIVLFQEPIRAEEKTELNEGLLVQQRSETRLISPNGSYTDPVSSMVLYQEPVNKEKNQPQGENTMVRTETLQPCDNGKGSVNPVMKKQKKVMILNEGKRVVVCALSAEMKLQPQAKVLKKVKPLLINANSPPGFETSLLHRTIKKQHKRAKHYDVKVSKSQITITEKTIPSLDGNAVPSRSLETPRGMAMELVPISMLETLQSTEQQQSEMPLMLEFPNPGVLVEQERKKVKQELPSRAKVQGRRRGRPPKLIEARVTTKAGLLPYQHGHKQKRERPPKAKVDADTTSKRRGRPPKNNPDILLKDLLRASNKQD